MERMFKKFFSVTALLSVVAVQAATNTVTPTVIARSQSFNGARKNVGSVGEMNKYDMDEFYGTVKFTPFYERSFRKGDLAECLFGDDLVKTTDGDNKDCSKSSRTINIQGSTVATRAANAWLADYFYLPSDFSGTITFDPVIQNAGVDLQVYLGLDEWVGGVYFRAWAPINWTKWDLGFKEQGPATPGAATYPAGVFAPVAVPPANLLKSFTEYASGTEPTKLAAPNDTIIREGLAKAKIGCDSKSTTQLADLRAELGWNFFNEEDYHFGINVQIAAPTGNTRKGEFVFTPVVGNGNKWELGGGVSGHYTFWRSEDEEKHFGFYVDAMVTHLFSSTENRTFDLKGTNKGNSRYMLAEKLETPVVNGLSGSTVAGGGNVGTITAASAQFKTTFAPVANLTTVDVDVSVGAQGSVTAWFNYTTGGLGFDLGYEFYGRSCEKIKLDDCKTAALADGKTWALKGDARVFGFTGDASGALAADTAVGLSATQSNATIRTGTNLTFSPNDANQRNRNFGIDNAQFAGANGTDDNDERVRLLRQAVGVDGSANNDASQTKTSIQPSFIKQGDIDFEGQETRGISHKVFAHLNLAWDREGWVPYLGIGGEAEFGKTNGNDDKAKTTTTSSSVVDCRSSCLDCTVSHWGIWAQGGISF